MDGLSGALLDDARAIQTSVKNSRTSLGVLDLATEHIGMYYRDRNLYILVLISFLHMIVLLLVGDRCTCTYNLESDWSYLAPYLILISMQYKHILGGHCNYLDKNNSRMEIQSSTTLTHSSSSSSNSFSSSCNLISRCQ